VWHLFAGTCHQPLITNHFILILCGASQQAVHFKAHASADPVFLADGDGCPARWMSSAKAWQRLRATPRVWRDRADVADDLDHGAVVGGVIATVKQREPGVRIDLWWPYQRPTH
jgi:hypothetical protein